MDILFLIGAVQAFFFASLFISRKEIIHEHKILIAFFFINGILLLDHYMEISAYSLKYPHLIGLSYALPLILGPTLYYYTLVISSKEKIKGKRFFILHGLPFLLLLFFLFLISISFPLTKNWLITSGKVRSRLPYLSIWLSFSSIFFFSSGLFAFFSVAYSTI